MILLDTCFIIYELEEGEEKRLEEFCRRDDVFVASFNIAELEHVSKNIPAIEKPLRRLLKSEAIKILEIPVSPGEREAEKKFANDTDEKILRIMQDPSDAVLIAAAIRNKADVITRDKHHIFKTALENELNEYKIAVYKDISSIN